MNWTGILELSVASILVNNIVLTRLIGVCPLCGMHWKLSGALGMGASATVVMGVASALSWLIDQGILLPMAATYLQTFVFILVIVSLALIADMALMKLVPNVYKWAESRMSAMEANAATIRMWQGILTRCGIRFLVTETTRLDAARTHSTSMPITSASLTVAVTAQAGQSPSASLNTGFWPAMPLIGPLLIIWPPWGLF